MFAIADDGCIKVEFDEQIVPTKIVQKGNKKCIRDRIKVLNNGENIKYNVHERWLLLYKVGLAIDIIPEKGGQCSFYLQTSEKSR